MKRYWFKRRRYGYGWFPSTWQGWLVAATYLLVVIGAASALANKAEAWIFAIILILATTGLIKICVTKGPRPRWRWGKKPSDNPEEDF